MTMKTITTILIFFVIQVSTASAIGHQPLLHPAPGIFESFDWHLNYLLKVREILYSDLCNSPAFRMTTLPSFEPEWTIEIEFPQKGPAIVRYVTVKERMIWQNKNPNSLKKINKTSQIPRDLATDIYELIGSNLQVVNYPSNPSMLLDGTNYIFTSFHVGQSYRSGITHSPEREWPTGKLVAVGELLREIALVGENGRNNLIERLKETTRSAKERLTKEITK